MHLTYSKQNLKKLEQFFKSLKYVIRYEKGNFNAGNCIVHDKNVVIINKFFPPKIRFEVLSELYDKLSLKNAHVPQEQNATVSIF